MVTASYIKSEWKAQDLVSVAGYKLQTHTVTLHNKMAFTLHCSRMVILDVTRVLWFLILIHNCVEKIILK
jgi:hypothetical protein